jgi:hypothetical protein
MLVKHEPSRLGVVERFDAEQVPQLPLESAGRE